MSADRTALIGFLLFGAGLALAAEEELRDPEFREYLGTWEESDEDWQIFVPPISAEVEKERSEPVPEGEDSTEKTDES